LNNNNRSIKYIYNNKNNRNNKNNKKNNKKNNITINNIIIIITVWESFYLSNHSIIFWYWSYCIHINLHNIIVLFLILNIISIINIFMWYWIDLSLKIRYIYSLFKGFQIKCIIAFCALRITSIYNNILSFTIITFINIIIILFIA